MKKMIIIAVVFSFFSCPVFGENQQELPSFYELSKYNQRYPDTDTNIDLYKRSWKNSHQHIGHGGFIEREVLFPGNPLNPPRPGAVLKYIKAFNHGVLSGNCMTQPTVHEKEQVFFFVTKGSGRIEAGGKKAGIFEGSCVFIPAQLEYQFFNTSETPMEVVIVVEDIPDGFKPAAEIEVENYHDVYPKTGWHWAYVIRKIASNAKFANPMEVSVVSIDAFDIAHPHVHREGTEDIWYQLKGESLLLFGKHLRHQKMGEAFLVPPNGRVPHSSINHTNEPMLWLHLSIRKDQKKPSVSEDRHPYPSFEEFSDWGHRNPETDVNIDLYKRSWKDSHQHIGHGGFIEREILFPGDPLNPSEPGAVLKILKAYNHGVLNAKCKTQSTIHEKEQVIFFVIKGEGRVEAGGKTAELSDGTGVFMPAQLEYQFYNTSDDIPLEMLIIVEEIYDGFEPLKEMIVGNYHDSSVGSGWHWAHIHRGIFNGAKFANPIGIGVITFDAFNIAQPHTCPDDLEEIWFQLKGKTLLFLGKHLRWHEEGEAFLVQPTFKVPHCTINHTDEEVLLIYMGIRYNKERKQASKEIIERLTVRE